jgi:hypothetical protein
VEVLKEVLVTYWRYYRASNMEQLTKKYENQFLGSPVSLPDFDPGKSEITSSVRFHYRQYARIGHATNVTGPGFHVNTP